MSIITEENFPELLQRHGISVTPQRLSIAQILFSGPRHLSADQVIGELKQAGKKASKATVYNTLGLFSKAGLVREVIVDPGCVFYDSNTTPHQHLYDCEQAELSDISPEEINVELLKDLPGNVQVESIDVIIRFRKRKS